MNCLIFWSNINLGIIILCVCVFMCESNVVMSGSICSVFLYCPMDCAGLLSIQNNNVTCVSCASTKHSALAPDPHPCSHQTSILSYQPTPPFLPRVAEQGLLRPGLAQGRLPLIYGPSLAGPPPPLLRWFTSVSRFSAFCLAGCSLPLADRGLLAWGRGRGRGLK